MTGSKKCPYCDGKGKTKGLRVAEYSKCRGCGGTGYVISCAFCKGTGRYVPSGLFNSTRKCTHCDGKGYY